uniref:Uncharacterized protein n=1 Tax=candidate division WWE3 bacterium TaxID=2053526 RepID=A0A7C4XIK2_UNCKA
MNTNLSLLLSYLGYIVLFVAVLYVIINRIKVWLTKRIRHALEQYSNRMMEGFDRDAMINWGVALADDLGRKLGTVVTCHPKYTAGIHNTRNKENPPIIELRFVADGNEVAFVRSYLATGVDLPVEISGVHGDLLNIAR